MRAGKNPNTVWPLPITLGYFFTSGDEGSGGVTRVRLKCSGSPPRLGGRVAQADPKSMSGKGVKQDDNEATKWFRKAAEQGLPTGVGAWVGRT